MQELVCPNCGKEFKIDGSGYAEILKQVRNSEFNSDLRERLKLADSEKQQAIELAEVKLKSELDKILTSPKRDEVLKNYEILQEKLGGKGASKKTATLIVERLKK